MVNSTDRTVFFADILGFSNLASSQRAEGAIDALSDLNHLLSSQGQLARILQSNVWEHRYALSDSLFLVAVDPAAACRAAAELFFDLAYVNHGVEAPVLLRGGIATGEVLRVNSVFPEFSAFNLVGEAVVRAVKMETRGPKGPRLFVDSKTVQLLTESSALELGIVSDSTENLHEMLWLLPADPSSANGLLIGEVCETAFRLAEQNASHPRYGAHYLGYLDLVVTALERLRTLAPSAAAEAISRSDLKGWAQSLTKRLAPCGDSAAELLRRMELLLKP